MFTIIDNVIINNSLIIEAKAEGTKILFTYLDASPDPYIKAQQCNLEVLFPDEDAARDALEIIAEEDAHGSKGIIITTYLGTVTAIRIVGMNQ